MEFDLNSYQPIDYRNWVLGNPAKTEPNDPARNGVNIKRLNVLTPEELLIWNTAVPFQDQRNDPGHGEQAVYSSLKLLPYYPDAKREIVVPATIFHDTGWYGNDPDAWKRLVEANKDNLKVLEGEASRRSHQNRGIAIASMILERIGYIYNHSIKDLLEIADIIGDHDTRKLPATDSGKIVRIADLLWRATYPHCQIYMANESPQNIVRRFEETCLSEELLPHLEEIGTQVARIELTNTLVFKFGKDVAVKVLKGNYEEELEKIASFY